MIEEIKNVDSLRAVFYSWYNEANGDAFGIDCDMPSALQGVQGLIDDPQSVIFGLMVDGEVVGFLGLQVIDSPIGRQRMVNEHFFYVAKEHRGLAAIGLLDKAKSWTHERGCSHLLLNASYLASDLHDDVCRLYHAFGGERFETTYILEVK